MRTFAYHWRRDEPSKTNPDAHWVHSVPTAQRAGHVGAQPAPQISSGAQPFLATTGTGGGGGLALCNRNAGSNAGVLLAVPTSPLPPACLHSSRTVAGAACRHPRLRLPSAATAGCRHDWLPFSPALALPAVVVVDGRHPRLSLPRAVTRVCRCRVPPRDIDLAACRMWRLMLPPVFAAAAACRALHRLSHEALRCGT